ncbi:RNA polymerase II-associated protein 1-like isoform X2 [Tachypleus tridentatus]|uniref:RNA polymerase II-associated protein 1-like isoform X2 n=1 Tax=Tachypleus tridentatus TaxID=6853 RepID=UPI003FD599ED
MSRSSLQSQRVIGIQTLAQILTKYWQGLLDGCFKEKFLSQLLEAGIVPLLRWALDDSTDSVIAAAVHAIQSLIVAGPDEMCLDQTFSWFQGCEAPSIRPPSQLASEKLEKDSDMSELTDSQIISMDVIKGFLRTDILPRLRYILEVCHPVAAVVGHIFDILIRITRHSLESATQVKDFNIMELVACYITIDPSDGKLPVQEIVKLSLESLRTWRVFLAYGLTSEVYIDDSTYPVLSNTVFGGRCRET